MNEFDKMIEGGSSDKKSELTHAENVPIEVLEEVWKRKPRGTVKIKDESWHNKYEQAHFKWSEQRYPNLHKDGHYVKAKFPDVSTHSGLETAASEYVKFIGGIAVQTATVGVPSKSGMRKAQGKGKQDRDVTLRSINMKWEFKTGKGVQSPDQKKYQAKIEAAGGIYYVIRNMQQVFDICDKIVGECLF